MIDWLFEWLAIFPFRRFMKSLIDGKTSSLRAISDSAKSEVASITWSRSRQVLSLSSKLRAKTNRFCADFTARKGRGRHHWKTKESQLRFVEEVDEFFARESVPSAVVKTRHWSWKEILSFSLWVNERKEIMKYLLHWRVEQKRNESFRLRSEFFLNTNK